jgi:hypothetical protein
MAAFMRGLIAALARDTPAYSIGSATSESWQILLLRSLSRPVPSREFVPEAAGAGQSAQVADTKIRRTDSLRVIVALSGLVLLAAVVAATVLGGLIATATALSAAAFVVSVTNLLISMSKSTLVKNGGHEAENVSTESDAESGMGAMLLVPSEEREARPSVRERAAAKSPTLATDPQSDESVALPTPLARPIDKNPGSEQNRSRRRGRLTVSRGFFSSEEDRIPEEELRAIESFLRNGFDVELIQVSRRVVEVLRKLG